MAKKKKIKAIDRNTGEVVEMNAEDFGIDEQPDDVLVEDEPLKESQTRFVAEITGIVLKPEKRVLALTIHSPKMIEALLKVYKQQRDFEMKWRLPVESNKGNEIKKWEDVKFQTRLMDLTLKGDKATCHCNINHEGAVIMSQLIYTWRAPEIEFFLDGIQQTLF